MIRRLSLPLFTPLLSFLLPLPCLSMLLIHRVGRLVTISLIDCQLFPAVRFLRSRVTFYVSQVGRAMLLRRFDAKLEVRTERITGTGVQVLDQDVEDIVVDDVGEVDDGCSFVVDDDFWFVGDLSGVLR